MANSGTVIGNSVNVSGGHVARVRVEWQLASQSIGGNSSHINWQAYVDFFGCDAQLDNGHVNWNGGLLYNNGGRVYNYAGNFSNHTIGMGSGGFDIGHDGAGNANLYMEGDVVVYQTGTTSGSGTWGLPTIPRYANFTAYNIVNVTDVGFDIQISADNYCSDISYSIDGGATYTSLGAGSSASVTVRNLPSNTGYTVYGRITRADSGLTSYTGPAGVTTLPEGILIGL